MEDHALDVWPPAMANNREERFLMRQRGAGTRQLKDIGFDLSLPSAGQLSSNAGKTANYHKTPQSLSRHQSARKTPKTLPHASGSSIRSRRATSAQETPQGNSLPVSALLYATPRTAGSTATRQEQLFLTPNYQNEEHGDIALEDIAHNRVIQPTEDLNETEVPVGAKSTGKKRKKRKSIVQQPRKRKRTSIESLNEITFGGNQNAPTTAVPVDHISTSLTTASANSTPRLSAAHAVKVTPERKRSSVTARPKPNAPSRVVSTGRLSRDSTSIVDSPRSVQDVSDDITAHTQLPILEEVEEEEQEQEEEEEGGEEQGGGEEEDEEEKSDATTESNDNMASTVIPKQTIGRVKSSVLRPGVSTVIPSSNPRAVPVVDGVRSQTVPVSPSSSADGLDRQSKPKVNSIPIRVQKFSKQRMLHFGDDAKGLSIGPAPFPKKGSVNAADVLSQICGEIVIKTVEGLKSSFDKERGDARKAEWKRKAKAVEAFGDELDGRLFQLTEALDNNNALVSRLKQANKEKIAARDELLEIRRQREGIALQMDEIRSTHEESSRTAQNDIDISTMLQDIELAIQRGEAQPESEDSSPELDLRLRNVAIDISSAGGRLGLLDSVKRFNAFLEKAVSTLG